MTWPDSDIPTDLDPLSGVQICNGGGGGGKLPHFLVKSQLKVLSSACPDLVLWLYYVYIYIFLSLLHELYCNILLLSAVAVFFVLIV